MTISFRPWKEYLRDWVASGGREAVATTRASFLSTEARVGAVLGLVLWAVGRGAAGPWNLWPADLGGEVLADVRGWYRGILFLVQAGLLGAHVALGILWGAMVKNAGEALGLFSVLGKKTSSPMSDRRLFTAGVILLAHGGLFLADMGRHPAVYQESIFRRGGGWAWLQTQALGGSSWRWVLMVPAVMVAAGAAVHVGLRIFRWYGSFSKPSRTAMGVLGSALMLLAGGLYGVHRAQFDGNVGPNIVMITVDGLRDDGLCASDALSQWRRGVPWRARMAPPSNDLAPTLMTGLTGRSPWEHGVWTDVGAPRFRSSTSPSLPEVLREEGWKTALLADGPSWGLDAARSDFDHVKMASDTLGWRLARRQWERSSQLMPYLSSWRPGLLRGSALLADPGVLAEEAKGQIQRLAHAPRFFLWVHFSSPGTRGGVVSPDAVRRLGRAEDIFDGNGEKPEFNRRRAYRQNVWATQRAVAKLLDHIRRRLPSGSTSVLIWSPRAAVLSASEEEASRVLRGPAWNQTMWMGQGLPLRPVPVRPGGWARAVDVAPTVLSLVDIPIPPAWEGTSLVISSAATALEGIYAEAGGWPENMVGPMERWLVEDRHRPGHLRVAPAWEDPLRIFRPRALWWGDERLACFPGPMGVRWEYDPAPGVPAGPAGARLVVARTKELKDMMFRRMAAHYGWRPQNDYWIPETFLREEDPSSPPPDVSMMRNPRR